MNLIIIILCFEIIFSLLNCVVFISSDVCVFLTGTGVHISGSEGRPGVPMQAAASTS